MATVEMKISDLSAAQIHDDRDAVRLIVEHPEFSEPIGLDALADEVMPHLREQESQFVVVTVEDPNNLTGQRYVMPLEEFNNLFQDDDSMRVLQRALESQRQQRGRGRGRRRGGGSRSGGGRRRQGTPRRERIDYSSPEHAGEPHGGRISPAEQEYVREHLDEVNERLRRQGLREIDPTDLTMIERYGLQPPEDIRGVTQ